MASPTPGRPLDGIVVLEVGAFMAAPFATMHLADLGARVLKVENPATGGDPVRATGPFVEGESSPFARLNRNKESVGLDLKHPEGLEAFRRLVAGADVLVENLRPGTMRRLGLGYEELRALNPRLVYASASGWGQDGPLAMLPGLDIMAQARGGLMSITGTADGDPVKIGVPICDLVCAMYVSMAVLAALRQRDLDGEGQHVDVSLLEAGVSFAIWEAGKYFATGEVGAPLGSAHQSTAPYQAVRTADGHVTVGAVTPKTWNAFCHALGLAELLDDERYADASSRHAHRPTLIPAIEGVTTTLSTDEVIERLDEAGVPCAPIANYEQVFNDDHLNQRGYFWDAEHPVMGAVRQLGSPMRLSRTPVRRGNAGPLLGQDTRAALEEVAGFAPAEVDALAEAGVVAEPEHPGPPPHRPAGSPQLPPTDQPGQRPTTRSHPHEENDPMTELAPGVEGVLQRTVEPQHTTRRGEYDIFSTPNLVLLLEEAAIEALAPHLRDDQASVGTKVDVAHTAATLLGQTVTATATVTEVDRRRVVFSINVVDDVEEIGSGTHERFIVDVPGFEDRLAQKSSRLG